MLSIFSDGFEALIQAFGDFFFQVKFVWRERVKKTHPKRSNSLNLNISVIKWILRL